jgi:hypothetical protein
MPLILAIEPDRQQASRLAALTPVPLKAELIVADSTERGFAALGDRVPDLILTSLLLSSKDEAALADRLRDLDGPGVRVQTLVIPVLSTPSRRSAAKIGILNKLRRPARRNSTPDGCDPSVFAEQIAQYLKDAAAERDLAVDDPSREPQDTGAFVDRAPDLSVETAEELDDWPTSDDASVGPVAAERNVRIAPSEPDRGEVADGVPDPPAATTREREGTSSSETETSYDHHLAGWAAGADPLIEPLSVPSSGFESLSPQDEARGSDLDEDIAAFLEALPKFDIGSEPADPPPTSTPVTSARTPVTPAGTPVMPAGTGTPVTPQGQSRAIRNASTEPPRRKNKEAQPVQDEWAFFDPERCGFAALLAKLDDLVAANK